MSQMGSWARVARDSEATVGGPSRAGAFMSAILTYFAALGTEGTAERRDRAVAPVPRRSLHPARKRALMGGQNITGVGPRRKSVWDRGDRGAAPSPGCPRRNKP